MENKTSIEEQNNISEEAQSVSYEASSEETKHDASDEQ